KYWYQSFSAAPYPFQPGDYIEYDVRLLNKVAGAGGIDIYLTEGPTFRDMLGWQDQDGHPGHPDADLSAVARKTWFHRKMAVPAGAVGKTASRWTIAGENDTDNITYSTQ